MRLFQYFSFLKKVNIIDFFYLNYFCESVIRTDHYKLIPYKNSVIDISKNAKIYIRGEAHSVLDAVLRQLAHYPYHIGQIIYIAKMLKNNDWKTLSIARNQSQEFNIEMLKRQNAEEIQQNSSPVCYAKSDEVRDEFKN